MFCCALTVWPDVLGYAAPLSRFRALPYPNPADLLLPLDCSRLLSPASVTPQTLAIWSKEALEHYHYAHDLKDDGVDGWNAR